MQPYFLPYIGYFQLIAAVDTFIVYDNIKYTKKGWINRNRMLRDGKDVTFSLPLKGGSDFLDIREREIAADFDADKMLNQFANAYRRAPYFPQTFPLVEKIVRGPERNLFRFLHQSIIQICADLGITTQIRISSDIHIDHQLKNENKVLALCEAVGADTYVNAIGGKELYSKETFRDKGIDLKFLQSKPFEYAQFGDPFVPWLSILDVMMFNSGPRLTELLTGNFEFV